MSNLFSELPYYLWWVVDILWGAFGIYAFILLDGKARILLLVSSLIISLLARLLRFRLSEFIKHFLFLFIWVQWHISSLMSIIFPA